MNSKGISSSQRYSRMHHRKQKAGNSGSSGAVGKSIGRRDSGMEAMTKLRYLNKKPLCLQYNIPSNLNSRRNAGTCAKRKEQSFIIVIFCGICKLVQWAAKGLQQATVDFLVKPAHELFPEPMSDQYLRASFCQNQYQLRRRQVTAPRRMIVKRTDLNRMLHSIEAKGY